MSNQLIGGFATGFQNLSKAISRIVELAIWQLIAERNYFLVIFLFLLYKNDISQMNLI